jgi:membrane protease YdiL (CAAX protease family)
MQVMVDFIVQVLFLLVFLAFFYGACAGVQVSQLRPGMRYVIIGLFATVGALVILLGLLSLAAPAVVAPRQGRLLLALGAATVLPLLRPVRRLVARLTPMDPDSTIDVSGLVVLGWLFVALGTVLFTINLDEIAGSVKLTLSDVLTSALAYPALGFSLVGVFVTRSWRESVKRLGLGRVGPRQAALALGLVAPLLALSYASDFAGRALQPQLYAKVDTIISLMSSVVTNPLIAVVLGLATGTGEEILFRGAVQPRYGIVLSALAWAVLHSQYGASFAIAGVFVTGIVLGFLRKYLNTTACIITHAAYNTVAFLLNAGG